MGNTAVVHTSPDPEGSSQLSASHAPIPGDPRSSTLWPHSLLLANEARTENHLLWSVKPHFNARSVLFTWRNLACKWLQILKLFGA